MQEVTSEVLQAMVPEDTPALFFAYKPHYDRTRWVAHVVAELINPDLGAHRRAVVWFAKGVSEDDVQQMMQEIGELVEADSPQENVRIYFDIGANVDASWIRIAEKILRDKKRSKARKRRVRNAR